MAIIDDIYDSLLDEEAFDALAGRLSAELGARSAVIQMIGKDSYALSAHYFTPEMQAYYIANNVHRLDIWHHYTMRSRRLNQAINSADVLASNVFVDSAFYNEFFRHFGDDTAQCLGGVLTLRDGGLMSFGLHRPYRANPFDDATVQTLDALTPHIRRLGDVRARLSAGEARIRDAEALIDRLEFAVALVDESGRILFANAAAEAIMAAADGLASRNGVLHAARADSDRLEAALTQAALRTGTHGDAMRIRRPSGRPAYRVMVTPHYAPGSGRSCALVLIDDPEADAADPRTLLIRMFGLTAAEADLTARLMDGLSPAEAAEARGVGMETVRRQMTHIFAKTDTARQSHLLAMLARLPRLSRRRDTH